MYFCFDEKCNQMTIKVGVSSSAGYIRKMKRTSGSMNGYYTFYSTFGINSKLGAKDTFEIQLDKIHNIEKYNDSYKIIFLDNNYIIVEDKEIIDYLNKKI